GAQMGAAGRRAAIGGRAAALLLCRIEERTMLDGKHILLIVSGGIAAVKSPELVRAIQKAGGSVQVILTENAKQFTTPLALATLSGRPALDTLFDLTRETEIGHIELSRSADL